MKTKGGRYTQQYKSQKQNMRDQVYYFWKAFNRTKMGGEGKFFDLIDTSKSHSDCFYVENLLVSEIKLNKWNYSKCEK